VLFVVFKSEKNRKSGAVKNFGVEEELINY